MLESQTDQWLLWLRYHVDMTLSKAWGLLAFSVWTFYVVRRTRSSWREYITDFYGAHAFIESGLGQTHMTFILSLWSLSVNSFSGWCDLPKDFNHVNTFSLLRQRLFFQNLINFACPKYHFFLNTARATLVHAQDGNKECRNFALLSCYCSGYLLIQKRFMLLNMPEVVTLIGRV